MTCGYFVVGISGFISLNKWVGLCWTDLQLDVWLLFKYIYIYTYTVVTTTSAACAITYHSGNCYGYQYRCFQIDLPFDFDSV